MRKHVLIIIINTLCLAGFAKSIQPSARITKLTVEGRVSPQGLDNQRPRMGWQLSANENNIQQKAYRLIVASTHKKAISARGDIFDSGMRMTDSSQWVCPTLPKLHPNKKYYWRTRVLTNKGWTEWSDVSEWTTGLLDESNWQGEWIGLDSLLPGESDGRHSRISCRYLRKQFEAKRKVSRATMHICGLGLYQLDINDKKVGCDVLTPSPTDYTKSVIYNTYDVTSLISSHNIINVTLAAGYYFAPAQNYQTNVRTTYGYPKLRANLILEYTNGTTETISTDTSWEVATDGPVRYANIYDGEFFDSRMSPRNWQPARVVSAPGGKLVGNLTPQMAVYAQRKPVAIWKRGDSHIVDFGENGAGWVAIRTALKVNDTLRIRYAETLRKDSTIYTDNLRSAQQTDWYVSDGKPRLWTPQFVYHGFRYAEITGTDIVRPDDVTMELVADRMDTDGFRISFGDGMLDRLVLSAYRGVRSNYKGMPIDCPQRDERMPWLGDRTTGCLGESYLMDNRALYTKWVKDICECQRPDGAISDVAPAYWRLYNHNITWPAALPFACDMLYRQYGDLSPMAESFDNIIRWLNHVKKKSYDNGIITYDRYGDWCVPPEDPKTIHTKDSTLITDGSLISTSYYIYLCRLLARYADMLGKHGQASSLYHEAEISTDAFNRKFLHGDNYSNGTLTANLLPLAMDIVPEYKRQAIEKSLLTRLANRHHGKVGCGVIGIQWLMRYLNRIGRNDLALKIATQQEYPGWGYMMAHGATTIWELWNGDTANPAMNSGNHVMLLGDLLPWCYEAIAGIQGENGFKHIVMSPDFNIVGIASVSASHPTPYGTVTSKWKRREGKITWDIEIPVNTTATIQLPTGEKQEIGSGKYYFVSNPSNPSNPSTPSNPSNLSNPTTPIMGWSSWNTYRVNINDSLISKQADAMVALGLSKAGYDHINIDDGFFGWRDSTGLLHTHPIRFPNGMEQTVNHIHSLGLKAGIYTDAGRNTCGSIYDNDSCGLGTGIFGHEEKDADLFFNKWGFDFIKIDYCGAGPRQQKLDEQQRYTEIANAINHTARKSVDINICRWAFPGTWAENVAASWRISSDIRSRWSSIKNIIEKNMYLSAFARNGHFNDMDMLEIGRGLKKNEEEVHFGMWCMMCSPLLIGCDLTTIPQQSLNLLTNQELIALNQDPLGKQAYVVQEDGDCKVFVKDIITNRSTTRALAIYNPTDTTHAFNIPLSVLELLGNTHVRDLISRQDMPDVSSCITDNLPPHSVRILRLEAEHRTEPTRYEAEWAYLPMYDDLGKERGQIVHQHCPQASLGMVVANAGGSKDNTITWDNIYSQNGGDYEVEIYYIHHPAKGLEVTVNGQHHILTPSADGNLISKTSFETNLHQGLNTISIGCNNAKAVDIDRIELKRIN